MPLSGTPKEKIRQVLHEYKHHELHSGSSKGPVVRSRSQALAIAMSESGQSKKQMKRRCRKEYCSYCGRRQPVDIGETSVKCKNCGRTISGSHSPEKGDLYDSALEDPRAQAKMDHKPLYVG